MDRTHSRMETCPESIRNVARRSSADKSVIHNQLHTKLDTPKKTDIHAPLNAPDH